MSDIGAGTPRLSPISVVSDRQTLSVTPSSARNESNYQKSVDLASQSINRSTDADVSYNADISANTGRSAEADESAITGKSADANDSHQLNKSEVDRQTVSQVTTPTVSPVYTETWDDYNSPRKSQLSTHRSRESGRLSPMLETTVEVGTQPLTLPRFNEPLKLRKGRHFVDYEAPAPTVVYVPHRSSTHGRWSNVSVQRNADGRWVVIEQRPVHTQFTDAGSRNVHRRDVFGHETSWTKKKSPWSWSTKGEYIERSMNRAFYEPYLPPLKPRYGNVDSKVGSMDNYLHSPGGGNHKIPNFKLKWEAEAKVGSLPNTSRENYSPASTLKLPDISPRFGASASSGSFSSVHYTPGGNVILRRQKYDAKSRVGSLDNVHHEPMKGDISIPSNSVKWRKEAKIGSLDNVTHLPKNSNIQVFKEKLHWKTDARINSMENVEHKPKKSRFRVPNFKKDWKKEASPRVSSLANVNHAAKGGNAQIFNEKLKWNAKPRIQSHWKMNFDYKSLFESDEEFEQNFSESASYPFTV